MQAFSTFTLKRDVDIAENGINELVHSRLFKLASVSRLARELRRSLNLRIQKLPNICTKIPLDTNTTLDTER